MDGELSNGDHQSSGGSPFAEKAELATSVIKAVRTNTFFLMDQRIWFCSLQEANFFLFISYFLVVFGFYYTQLLTSKFCILGD